jgi:type II secretory pathway component PulF
VERSGADIPAVSRLVIGTGVWMQANWYYAVIGLVCLVAGLQVLARTQSKALRRLAQSLPGAGPLMRRVDLETWARTLGIALANGSQLLLALDLAANAVRSSEFANQLQGVRREVRAGAQLDEAFETNVPRADPMLLDLMATGRKSGTLDRMLLFAADTYRDEISALSKRLTAIAEPVAILMISAVVGTLVVAIVLAMTSLYNFDV